MNKKETIDLTDKLLNNALNVKNQLLELDIKIKKGKISAI